MRRGGHGAAVDVLIKSAGIFDDKPLEQVTADDLRRMYEVNLIGLFITTQAALARMPDGGRIINISSRACLGFWGAVDFHQAGRLAEPLRLVQELAISGLAAVADGRQSARQRRHPAPRPAHAGLPRPRCRRAVTRRRHRPGHARARSVPA